MAPRTIDNLGVEFSNRYADDQQKLDPKMIKESRSVPMRAEIDVTIPSYSSEFELLFETQKRNVFWADFHAPAGFNEQKKRLFTFQIVPAIGSEDKQEMQADRIKARIQRQVDAEHQDKTRPWEEEREEQEEDKEQKALLSLLQKITVLDRYLIDINSRRNQYQRG